MRLFKYLPLGVSLMLASGLQSAKTPNIEWMNWLENQINQHSDIIAARETMNAALSRADGQIRPRYNPELETEYEREGVTDNYRLGLNQTIDWRDQRGTRRQRSVFDREAARQTYALAVAHKTSDALKALIAWQAARKIGKLARQQETQLDTLLTLVKKRLRVGDLSQVDADLAVLSLTQRLNTAAQAQVDLKRAETRSRKILPGWSPEQAGIPEVFWRIEAKTKHEQSLENHPAVATARAEWKANKQAAEIARKQTRSDPSIGINIGKTDDEDVFGLRFSLPLNIRNNFSAEARAASQLVLASKSRYQTVRRNQQLAVEASKAVLGELRQRLEQWHSLVKRLEENSEKLLERQWHSGDLSTAEYLLSLQQRAEGLQAGIELQQQYRTAFIDWLYQTGQMHTALSQMNPSNTQ